MIPSKSWFPQSLAERAAWMQNFATNFVTLGPTLGFNEYEVDAVTNDNIAFQWLAQIGNTVESYSRAMTAYRKAVTEGPTSASAVDLPLPPTYPTTPPLPDPGMFTRLDALVKRIRVAPAYSPEDGAALGIIPSKPENLLPSEMKPDPKVTALPGNIIQVDFTRGRTEGIEVQVQVDNSGSWENAGRFFKSPGEVMVPNNAQSTARSVMVRARYLLDNKPVGEYSDIDQVSTMP